MKYSLRKSFSYRRRTELHDDDQIYPRLDANDCSNSNSNLVKTTKKNRRFLRRERRFSSSPSPGVPPPASTVSSLSLSKKQSKKCEPAYKNHLEHDDRADDDDDPFSSLNKSNVSRTRPFDRLTNQIRKSFRNTLTRPRARLESTNSNKRLIFNSNDVNPPVNSVMPPISTGLSSQVISSVDTVVNDTDQIKISMKRRRAPLAPTHLHQSYVARRGIVEHERLSIVSL
jgi:hypothetical protein